MIQIDRDLAYRGCELGRTLPAAHFAPRSRTTTSTEDDRCPLERPPLFVVPPPQTVWPRVFPGL